MPAADGSPATFRVSQEERYLLEAVAHYTGKSMSAFVRDAALVLARKVVDDAGAEAVLEGDRQWSEKGRLTIEERRRALEQQRELSSDEGNR